MILLCAGGRVQLCHVRLSFLYVRPFVRSSVCAVGPYSVEFLKITRSARKLPAGKETPIYSKKIMP